MRRVIAGKDGGRLGVLRGKLIEFLKHSRYYNAGQVLATLEQGTKSSDFSSSDGVRTLNPGL